MNPEAVVDSWSVISAVPRGQRDQLVRLWLACPDDVLEPLWSGSVGQATREMVAQLSSTTFFSDSQIALRNRLGEFLRGGFQQPGAVKAVLATFLLSPPGQFRIINPESHLPAWLIPSYRSLYEQGQPPAPQVASISQSNSTPPQPQSAALDLPKVQFGQFPSTLQELIGDRLQLNRLLGLSNLYYIDPDDKEIREELLQLREQLVRILLDADESKLESYFSSDFGDRFWALVRSGIQSIPLSTSMDQLKNQIKQKLNPELGGGFGKPGAIPAFLVAMTLYEPGTMQVQDAEQKLPAWLLPGYQQIFLAALNA